MKKSDYNYLRGQKRKLSLQMDQLKNEMKYIDSLLEWGNDDEKIKTSKSEMEKRILDVIKRSDRGLSAKEVNDILGEEITHTSVYLKNLVDAKALSREKVLGFGKSGCAPFIYYLANSQILKILAD